MSIVLLEYEEDLRLAGKIYLKNNGIEVNYYIDYEDYSKNKLDSDTVITSSEKESKKYGFYYLEKPYTAHELMDLVRRFL